MTNKLLTVPSVSTQTEEKKTCKCSECGRTLKNPKQVLLGIGETCAKKRANLEALKNLEEIIPFEIQPVYEMPEEQESNLEVARYLLQGFQVHVIRNNKVLKKYWPEALSWYHREVKILKNQKKSA